MNTETNSKLHWVAACDCQYGWNSLVVENKRRTTRAANGPVLGCSEIPHVGNIIIALAQPRPTNPRTPMPKLLLRTPKSRRLNIEPFLETAILVSFHHSLSDVCSCCRSWGWGRRLNLSARVWNSQNYPLNLQSSTPERFFGHFGFSFMVLLG